MSNVTSSHQTSIVITPPMLKQQIIIRLNTLVSKQGGAYYPKDEKGNTKPLAVIEGMEIHGIETKGRNVYLIGVPVDESLAINLDSNGDTTYNANEFYLEQLWEVYLGCESIYQSKMVDYGTVQD